MHQQRLREGMLSVRDESADGSERFSMRKLSPVKNILEKSACKDLKSNFFYASVEIRQKLGLAREHAQSPG